MTIVLGTLAKNGGMLRMGRVILGCAYSFALPVSNSPEGGSTTTSVHL